MINQHNTSKNVNNYNYLYLLHLRQAARPVMVPRVMLTCERSNCSLETLVLLIFIKAPSSGTTGKLSSFQPSAGFHGFGFSASTATHSVTVSIISVATSSAASSPSVTTFVSCEKNEL